MAHGSKKLTKRFKTDTHFAAVVRGSYCQSILDVLALYKEFATGDHGNFDWKLVAGIGGIQTDSLNSAVGECLQLRAIGLVLDACSSTEALLFGVGLRLPLFTLVVP